jgi:hypothetical protein
MSVKIFLLVLALVLLLLAAVKIPEPSRLSYGWTGLAIWLLVAMLLSGCAAMWQPKMDAEQLKAVAADKNAGMTCATVTGMYGTVKIVTVNMDKSVIANGAVTVDGEKCSATITTEKDRKP